MWHKAEWMGYPMRLEITREGLLVKLANHYTTLPVVPRTDRYLVNYKIILLLFVKLDFLSEMHVWRK